MIFIRLIHFVFLILIGYTLSLILITKCAQGAMYLDTTKYKLLDVQEVSVDGYKIADHRNGFSSNLGYEWYEGFAINLDLRLLYNLVFMDTRVETFGTESQLREAGMWWRTGVNLSEWFQVYYMHHSDHILDGENADGTSFVLENYYGVRLYFLRKD